MACDALDPTGRLSSLGMMILAPHGVMGHAGVRAMQDNFNTIFAQAEAAFGRGDNEAALALVMRMEASHIRSANLFHLKGLIFRRLGRVQDACHALETAVTLAPADPQIANNLGNAMGAAGNGKGAVAAYRRALALALDFVDARLNLAITLHRLGDFAQARTQFQTLARHKPATARFWNALAALERDCGDLVAARHAYDQAHRVQPGSPVTSLGLAQVMLEQGDPAAAPCFAALHAAYPGDLQIVMGLADALEAQGDPTAIDLLANAVRGHPDWVDGHRRLARMRAEVGDTDCARSFAEVDGATAPFHLEWANSLAHAGQHRDALLVGERAIQRGHASPQLALGMALWSSEAGDTACAEHWFSTLDPAMDDVAAMRARHYLRQGDPARAAALLEAVLLDGQRNDVAGWAYLGLAWRLLDDARAAWLYGDPPFQGVRQLAIEPALLSEVAGHVRQLHRTRHHPLSQSLRGGTQTRGRLFDNPSPPIQRLRAALDHAVTDFIGALPPYDPIHPLLRHRNAAGRFAGSWSVRLTGGGFHIHHIHNQGWLSSACYLALPDIANGNDPADAGWLAIGSAPEELALPIAPLTLVRPKIGEVALFPSYAFHGTLPFTRGERLTVAFDIVADYRAS